MSPMEATQCFLQGTAELLSTYSALGIKPQESSGDVGAARRLSHWFSRVAQFSAL